ncbi:MAG: MFS transporter [Chloroflexi bacterium]|nr:MFS transporter [Chloroflexota bacterium]
MTNDNAPAPPHLRWNFFAFLVDYASFTLGMVFVNISSVMPALVGHLTESAPVIGLIGTIYRGAWLLPQLPAGEWIAQRPRKRPFMLISAIAGRLPFWILAVALWVGLTEYPAALLTLFFVCLALFFAGDGLATLAWFDVLARAIPARQRGRLIGSAQVLSGVLGIGAGALVSVIIDHPELPFPNDFALLFTLASAVITISTVALLLIREPPATQQINEDLPKLHNHRMAWLSPLTNDPTLRYFILCSILFGLAEMSMPFYVGHAERVLQLPPRIIGAFVVAQTIGGIGASAMLGPLSERRGPRYTIRIGSALSALGPILALVSHIAGPSPFSSVYPLVFVTLGIAQNVKFLGFSNYLLEIAPEHLRPKYVGLSNTILGLLTLAPMIGGWLLQITSYTVLFSATAILSTLGFLLTLGMASSGGIASSSR